MGSRHSPLSTEFDPPKEPPGAWKAKEQAQVDHPAECRWLRAVAQQLWCSHSN
jgi:hypothetical protein